MRLYEFDVSVKGLTDKSGGTFLWCYHPGVGLYIRRGRYAEHNTKLGDILNGDYVVTGRTLNYDTWDRGYLKLDPVYHNMYIMPTDPREYFSYNPKKKFKKEFPNWNIIEFDRCRFDFDLRAGRRSLSSTIKVGINNYLQHTVRNNWRPNKGLPTLKCYIAAAFSYKYQVVASRIIGQSLVVSNQIQKERVTPPAKIDKNTRIKDFTITPLVKKAK